jgi:hypothetical protein
MRLVATPDGSIDRRDRAIWLTLPFDAGWPLGLTVAACRTVTLLAESRSASVVAESRSTAVGAEARSLTVSADVRTLTAGAETRSVGVACG